MSDEGRLDTPYMTIEEAAKYLRLKNPNTLETWAGKGLVQYYSLAGKKLFSADLLDRFIMTRIKKGKV
ncbi:MAG: helix-turn-helix domain-containing protein [Planctomycetes bacterium]|nr:helix-turn-helix domain-containing protein [Planctomycetota bacterium]